MRIIMVHSGLLNTNTGGGIHTSELYKNFQSMGDVTCFIGKSKQHEDSSDMVGVPFINIPSFRAISYYCALFFYLFYYSMKLKPDVIYVRKSSLGISPLIVSKLLKVPYVLEVNGLIDDEIRMLKNHKNEIIIKFFILIDFFHFKCCNKIIAVSQGIKEQIILNYGISEQKISFIENGVSSDIFFPIERTIALSILKLNPSKKYVCFVGGLAPWHGVEYLVQSANKILKEFPNVLFLIIGDGPMKEALIQQIEKLHLTKNFFLTGNVDHSLVPYYINASELCVAPFTGYRNIRIGLSPLKIYEYLSCAKPVVASNIPGVSEIVLNSGGGILVKPDDSEELEMAILKLLKNEKIRTKMGQMGREYIILNHSWSYTAKKIFSIFINIS